MKIQWKRFSGILVKARIWLSDAQVFWNWLAFSAVIIVICYGFPGYWFERTELDRIKWCGMLFQLAGLYTVLKGLDQSQLLFNKDRLLLSIGNWFRRLPLVFKDRSVVSLSASSLVGVSSVASVGTVVIRDASIEGRVDRLTARLDALEIDTARRFDETTSHAQALIDAENAARSAGDAEIDCRLQDAIVGGMNLSLTGAADLFFGIVLTSIPEDVEKFLRLIWH